MRLIAGLSLAAVAQGLASSAAPVIKADKAPIKVDKAAYTKEWHKEWKQGEVPSWKETYPKAALAYEDRQSDGKIGTFLQAKPKAVKADKAPIKIDKAAYTKEWHKEWKQGEVPSWKETYPKEALAYEDGQSDGKIGTFVQTVDDDDSEETEEAESDMAAVEETADETEATEDTSLLQAVDDDDDDTADESVDVLEQAQLDEMDNAALLQADDNDDSEETEDAESDDVATDEADEDTEEVEETEDPVKADKAPTKIDKAAYAKEWHKEWKQGDVPSWKEYYPKSAHSFEDSQSDGKASNFLQAAPKKADKAPVKIDKAAYTKEWHKEWKQGKVPSWKETYPKAALPYEDRQSDGKIGN